jgi:hypothetical protein
MVFFNLRGLGISWIYQIIFTKIVLVKKPFYLLS